MQRGLRRVSGESLKLSRMKRGSMDQASVRDASYKSLCTWRNGRDKVARDNISAPERRKNVHSNLSESLADSRGSLKPSCVHAGCEIIFLSWREPTAACE